MSYRDGGEDIVETERSGLNRAIQYKWQQGPDGGIPWGSVPLLHHVCSYCNDRDLRSSSLLPEQALLLSDSPDG